MSGEHKYLICSKCKTLKTHNNFMKILDIRTYGIGCDDEGYVKKIRYYKTCSDCREELRISAKKNREDRKKGIYKRKYKPRKKNN